MGLMAVVAVIGSAPAFAEAGTILLARESTIRASGKAGSGDFDLLDGSKDFSGFADVVDTAAVGMMGPRVAANQNSRPASMTDGDSFTGAYAEGSASAGMDPGSEEAEAASNFDLTFQVLGAPSLVTFGGAVGVTGNGSTTVSLSNQTTGDVLLSQELLSGAGEGQSIEHSTVLDPGIYELCVAASVNGDASESMAYYSVSLSISPADDSGSPQPIPLPAAMWSALGVIGTSGAVGAWRKRRRSS
jgi:hypothetical protein